jgi:hypothetical protein
MAWIRVDQHCLAMAPRRIRPSPLWPGHVDQAAWRCAVREPRRCVAAAGCPPGVWTGGWRWDWGGCRRPRHGRREREKRRRKRSTAASAMRASERALLCLVGCCACACYKLGLTGGVHGVSWAGSGLRPPQHWVCLEDEREHNVDWTGLGPG